MRRLCTYQKYSTEEVSEIGSEENCNTRFGNSVSSSSCDHLRRESSISRRNQTPSEGSSRSESASVAAYPERSTVHTYHSKTGCSHQNTIRIKNRAVVNVFKVFCFVRPLSHYTNLNKKKCAEIYVLILLGDFCNKFLTLLDTS